MAHLSVPLLTALLLASAGCGAQVLSLNLAGDPGNVTISGVSSGAAMAVQYAVAHSASVAGVASIAGPPWGCARGEAGRAISDCMCGVHSVASQIGWARSLSGKKIDSLEKPDGPPSKLRRSYVFHSSSDDTVKPAPGQTAISFLTDFIQTKPVVDPGFLSHPSNRAEHGIISPDGKDLCDFKAKTDSYIRHCGSEDNAGKLFHALLAPGQPYPMRSKDPVPEKLVRFNQQEFIDAVKNQVKIVDVADDELFGFSSVKSPRRKNFDMAEEGYVYIPAGCETATAKCGVHVALHGCRQDVWNFADKAGYNVWAKHYNVIVIYPALKPVVSPDLGEACSQPITPVAVTVFPFLPKANPNTCWDWWGYLDLGFPYHRYVTKESPQIQVIELIIKAATGRK